jgi:thioredoxin-like negative regulator of GroEL
MKHVEYLSDLEEEIHRMGPVFVFFYREESASCRMLGKRLLRITRKYPRVASFVVDLDKHPSAAGQFLSYTVPTVSLYLRARPVFKRSDEIILGEVEKKLAEASAL